SVHFASTMIRPDSSPTPELGLGIDAGGTQTRWALAAPDGAVLAEGTVAGLSALQMGSPHGREAVRTTFAELAASVLPHGVPARRGRGAWRLAHFKHGAGRVQLRRRRRLGVFAPVHLRPGTRRGRQAGPRRGRQRRAGSGSRRHPAGRRPRTGAPGPRPDRPF